MEGSLTGFTIEEIFKILALTKKTGVLEIAGGSGLEGRVCFRKGQLYWAQSSTIDTPISAEGQDKQDQIKHRIEDVVFEIFDWGGSAYRFAVDQKVGEGGEVSFQVDALLADVAKRQAEWAEIRTEIPSIRAKIELISDVDLETITLSREQWKIVALIGQSVTVNDLQHELKSSSLSVCKALYEMSKMGLIRCLGEVVESKPEPRAGELEAKTLKKYIRKSFLADEEAENAMPVEWASYYQMLDSRKSALKAEQVAKAVEH